MRSFRLLLIAACIGSFLLNAVLAGIVVRTWSQDTDGSPTSVFFSMPQDMRQAVRASASAEDGEIQNARAALGTARDVLSAELAADPIDPVALQQAMANVRAKTEALQSTLHKIILDAVPE